MADLTNQQAHSSIERATHARRELIIFFVFLIPLIALGYWLLLVLHQSDTFLSWVPAIASILTRLVLRLGIGDISLRFGGQRTLFAILVALVLPLIVAGIAYGAAWIFGFAHLAVPTNILPKPLPSPTDPTLRFVWTLFLSLTVGTVLFFLFTTGEELGWRGFMLTRLVEAQIPRPIFVSGLIWGLYHVPDILSGGYKPGGGPSVLLAVVIFLVTVVSFAYFVAWIRLWTGSIWPCIIAHSAWNAVLQIAFDPATSGPDARLWIGESGIFVALLVTLVVIVIYRLWPLHHSWRTPGQPLISHEGTAEERVKLSQRH